MKETKQQQIDRLTAENEQLEQGQKRLRQIMFGEMFGYSYESALAQVQELKVKAAQLEERVKGYEGAENISYRMLRDENSRLWYMLRAITGDDTLKGQPEGEEANYQSPTSLRRTPFNSPNF